MEKIWEQKKLHLKRYLTLTRKTRTSHGTFVHRGNNYSILCGLASRFNGGDYRYTRICFSERRIVSIIAPLDKAYGMSQLRSRQIERNAPHKYHTIQFQRSNSSTLNFCRARIVAFANFISHREHTSR